MKRYGVSIEKKSCWLEVSFYSTYSERKENVIFAVQHFSSIKYRLIISRCFGNSLFHCDLSITLPVFPIGQYHSCICRIDKEKFPDLNLHFLSHIRSVNREIKTYDPLIRAGSMKHRLIETKTSTEILCKDRSFRQLCQKIQQDSKLNESGAH